MPFLSLSLYNFRNLKNDKIDLSSKEVFFVGENGQGKSNLLESLYYSAYGSSFRTHTDGQIIKEKEQNFSLRALYTNDKESTQQISIIFDKGKKIIEKNGKRIKDRKELINTIPCVVFCHDDMRFATGEPEFRRFFLDQSLTMYDALYIDDLRTYKKILKTRNLILKECKYEMLDIYDMQLAQKGIEIQKKRKKAIFQFNEIFGDLYERISGISGVSIAYLPSWKEIKEEVGSRIPEVNDILQILRDKREQDKIMNTTLSGPHRDKIVFMKDGKLFVPTASTGQCRLISLLLRVSQAVYYTRVTGSKPVLLMDDVMLELDPSKRQRLTAMLPEYDQLFCTFLPGEPYANYKKENTKVYIIKEGEWNEER
ncbi:MAG: DNA replication and repair protein RecF [Treponema sp.]|nr:DNA replication and repair protein RecF [Treponema sp.]